MTIKELRSKTGLSQSQFAKKYKLSIKQVQSWEQGRRNVPESTMYLLERCVNEDFEQSKDGMLTEDEILSLLSGDNASLNEDSNEVVENVVSPLLIVED